MGERRGTKALETWCRRVTQGYPGVKVENMTTSWRDGLAFCALIHHFRPDLIDFARLDKSDVYNNNELAFRIAERHLGIPALLDAEDMAEYPVPDRLSILTYLSQFYQAFASNSSSPVKKASTDSPDGSLVSLVQGNVQPQPKMEWSTRGREPCAVCKLPVFIAQRLRVGGRLYHRTCFRCGRCGCQLSPADSYETCAGEWVCETCPDEMPAPPDDDDTIATSISASVSATTSISPSISAATSTCASPLPPELPPDPPPSSTLVAARRLLFDTDDAKLLKQDHAVNTARIVHSIKKDLSSSVDTSSRIDSERTTPVNITLDKKSPEVDDSVKDSKSLVQCVNNSTNRFEKTKKSVTEEIDIKENDSVKLVVEKPLVISENTPSFNAGNKLNVEHFLSHSESDNFEKPSEVCIYQESESRKPSVKEITPIPLNNEHNKENTTTNRDIDEKSTSVEEIMPSTPISSQETKNPEVDETIPSIEEIPQPISENSKEVDENLTSIDSIEETRPSAPVRKERKSTLERRKVVETFNPVMHSSPKSLDTSISVVNKSEKEVKVKPSEYPEDLNPFGDSEDEEEEVKVDRKVSTNPFGSESEEEEETSLPVRPSPPRVTPRKMSLGSTRSTNPFGSDEEDEEEAIPHPRPRPSLQSSPEPTPFPRRSRLRTSARSITSLSSIGSYSSTTPRKKKAAPPPPTNQSPLGLTPSSRVASMTSLASTRSRKTKRAPLPPSPATGLPPLPKSPPPVLDNATSPPGEPRSLPPQLEVTSPSVSEDVSLDITGEIASQIEEGMQKLIAQHDEIVVTSTAPLSSKEEKDSMNETSKTESNQIVEEITSDKVELKTEDSKQDIEEIIFIDKENEINKAVSEEKQIEVPVVIVNMKESSLDVVSCDKVIDSFEEIKLDDKTVPIVEAFNEDILLESKNSSSVIKFDEIVPPAHSTPVKIIPNIALYDSSLEDVDVASGNTVSEIPFLSSPSASCADTSSYQESLASPPMEKRYKDSANMHKKISESVAYLPHKSVYGQWKRKKGPAPALPIPQRRSVKPMPMTRIRQELGDIEIKQQELERQGVALEQKIREKFDSDTSITPYLEELVLQLFELVNEKNELFRKQAELMYIRRQHQLEEEHAELEYQIRCLMARPEPNKPDSDKELEEKLIQRLVEVVERRDAIVQCLEMDRLREVEEDKSINRQLDKFTRAIITDDRMKIKKKHKKKKEKHHTLKMLDLDKDFDESEKDIKKKKKWYTLSHKGTKHM